MATKTEPLIDEARWQEVQKRGLMSGAHKSPAVGMCAMEALSYVRRQPFSDHPPCVSPCIAAFMRSWNDSLPDDERGMLIPLLPKLVNTIAPELEERRAMMAVDWYIREHVPVGEPTSISKELERLIGGYWAQQVGKDGKRTDSSYGTVSRAEWMMTHLCADDFGKEMKQHVVNVGGALKDHFREVLNNHVALMLSDVFHVKSAGDSQKGNPGRSCIDPPAKPVGAK